MHFLPDIYVPCEVCGGRRYNRETLEVLYKGKSIADILDMTADEALEFFENLPKIRRKVATLVEVGLGYIKLGQSLHDPLRRRSPAGQAGDGALPTVPRARRSIFSTNRRRGCTPADVHKLTEVLQRLVEVGNTVLVIEHNLDVIKTADYIIDLGPEGGTGGGTIVATGTPEEIAQHPASYTGKYLRGVL